MHTHQPRRALAVLAAVAATSLLAACGSSSSSSQSSPAATPTTSAASTSTPSTTPSTASTTASTSTTTASTSTTAASPASGAAINIGMICSCSGAQASQLSQQSAVIKVWAKYTNDNGGINGHPVNLTVLDDGGNPATALQDAKQLVEQDHIIAMVGEFSLADGAFATYMQQKAIPVIGGISPDAPFLSNPDFYPSGSQLVMQTLGTFALAKQAGKKHIGVLYCAESPICAELVPLAEGAAKQYGLGITTAKVSSTAPSYTATCLQLKSANVDSLFVGAASPVVQRVTQACAQQGFTPQTVSQTSTFSNAWLKDPSLNNALLTGYNANPYDASTPGVKVMQDALNKYAPGLTSGAQYNYDVIGSWAGGQLFTAAAKAGAITPTSTPADVVKGLDSLKNETLDGLAPPLNFVAGKPTFVPCYFTEQLKAGKLVSLNGNKPTCLTAAQAGAILKALHLA